MSKIAKQIVLEFIDLTNEKNNIKSAVALMAEDIEFVGPVARCNNISEYEALLNQFL